MMEQISYVWMLSWMYLNGGIEMVMVMFSFFF
jgi:hypothetical protein